MPTPINEQVEPDMVGAFRAMRMTAYADALAALIAERDELKAKLDTFPKLADNVIATLGMTVWGWYEGNVLEGGYLPQQWYAIKVEDISSDEINGSIIDSPEPPGGTSWGFTKTSELYAVKPTDPPVT